MTSSRRLVVEAALALVGVPFRPQGRTAAGLDCVGLILEAHRAAGAPLRDPPSYRVGETEVSGPLLEEVLAQGRTVTLEAARPGDTLVVLVNRHPRHLAILVSRAASGVLEVVHASTAFPRKVARALLEESEVALAVNFIGRED